MVFWCPSSAPLSENQSKGIFGNDRPQGPTFVKEIFHDFDLLRYSFPDIIKPLTMSQKGHHHKNMNISLLDETFLYDSKMIF